MNRVRHTAMHGWVCLSLAAAPAPVLAQTVVLDEGEFTIFVEGQRAGTESFAIRRNGTGPEAIVIAEGIVTIRGPAGPSQMRPILQARADLAPVQYLNQLEGQEVSDVQIRSQGQHFIAAIRSSEGERERELRAREGTVILDLRVAHHYFFVAARTERVGGAIPVVEPQSGRQLRLEVAAVDDVSITIAGASVPARRVRLGTGDQIRDVWFDDLGRVLQVDIPEAAYRAVRTSTQ